MRNTTLGIIIIAISLSSCSVSENILFTLTAKNQLNKYELSVDKQLKADSIYNLTVDKINNVLIKEATSFDSIPIPADKKELNFVTIHGAKSIKDPRHFKKLYDNICNVFGGPDIDHTHHSPIYHDVPHGQLIQWEYKVNSTLKLNFFDIKWSEITEEGKSKVNSYDENPNRYTLAKKLKKEYVVDYLGDLASYLNPDIRERMMILIDTSLSKIQEEIIDPDYYFIGGSFGSKLLYDYINYPVEGTKIADKIIYDNCTNKVDLYKTHSSSEVHYFYKNYNDENIFTYAESCNNKCSITINRRKTKLEGLKRIYFLSNQLPFINIKDLPYESSSNRAYYFKKIINGFSEGLKAMGKDSMEIISFYDPNDILGYPIPDNKKDDYNIINVELKNTPIWSVNPDRLRLFVLQNINNDININGLLSNSERQEIALNFFNVNGSTKNNDIVAKYIVKGMRYHDNEPRSYINLMGYKKKYYQKKVVKKLQLNKAPPKSKFINKTISKARMHPAELPFVKPNITKDIQGIGHTLRTYDTAHVVVIHGMRSKKPDFSSKMIALITNEFDMTLVKDSVLSYSDYYRDEIYGNCALLLKVYENSKNQQVYFYSIYWSPYTETIKDYTAYLESFTSADQSPISTLFKEAILNDGFIDVITVLKEDNHLFYKHLNKFFRIVDERINKGRHLGSTKENLFIISGSLGSNIMYEYLRDNIEVPFLNNLIENRFSTFYMLSNQLPLITLKDYDITTTNPFESEIYKWKPSNPDLNIIAFNDPNDLLSFKLKPITSPNLSVQTIDINVADGISFGSVPTARLARIVDKLFFLSTKRFIKKFDTEEDKKISELIKEFYLLELRRNIKNGGVEKFVKTITSGTETFDSEVIRFDIAHEGVNTHLPIIKVICHGSKPSFDYQK